MEGLQNLTGTFDRVVVVNLARRSDRLEQFRKRLRDWPFKTPERFEAVDGSTLCIPAAWDKGAGAWGCMLSHRALIEKAIADKISSLLVLEDDAYPIENFASRAAEFFANVPGDWDGLMLGAEHMLPPRQVTSGVVRCVASNRTHAYAVRGRFMRALAHFWKNTANDHCDIVLASLQPHFKIYSPDPLLIGQDGGASDVTGRKEPLRFLSVAQKEKIAEADPRYFIEKLLVRVPHRNPPTSISDRHGVAA